MVEEPRGVPPVAPPGEPTARTSLAGLLKAEGFNVLTAENGTEALSILLADEPDAALL